MPNNITRNEITKLVETVIADLKYQTENRQAVNKKNIHRALFFDVIRQLYAERGFLHHEKLSNGQEGCFIKGYVRDVWDFLESAYDLIHDEEFESEINLNLNSSE